MPGRGDVFIDAARVDRSNFSLTNGARAGAFAVAPLALGVALGNYSLVFATLGAVLLTNTEGPNSAPLPMRFLMLACLTEPVAFGLGTAVALTGVYAVPLVGIGVFIGMLAGDGIAVAQVGRITASFFAVGVGLPGASAPAIATRFEFSLAGALFAVFGILIHRRFFPPDHKKSEALWSTGTTKSGWRQLWPSTLSMREHIFRWSIALGIASAVGFAIGLGLGLVRDFWIVVTLITATRPRLGPTLSVTLTIVVGTVAGAVLAAAVTIGVTDIYALEVLLYVFAVLTFATRGVNLGLNQVFFTPFIIVLINILYSGQLYLAEVRVLDVGIGGALTVVTVYFLSVVETGRPKHPHVRV